MKKKFVFAIKEEETINGIHLYFGYFDFILDKEEKTAITMLLDSVLNKKNIVYVSLQVSFLSKIRIKNLLNKNKIKYNKYKLGNYFFKKTVFSIQCNSIKDIDFILNNIWVKDRIIFRIKKRTLNENIDEIDLCLQNSYERDLDIGLLKFNEALFIPFWEGEFIEGYIKNMSSKDILKTFENIKEKISTPIKKVSFKKAEEEYF